MRQKAARMPSILVKGPCTDSLTPRYLPWVLAEGQKLRAVCQRNTEKEVV